MRTSSSEIFNIEKSENHEYEKDNGLRDTINNFIKEFGKNKRKFLNENLKYSNELSIFKNNCEDFENKLNLISLHHSYHDLNDFGNHIANENEFSKQSEINISDCLDINFDINSLNLFDETNKSQEDNEVQTGKTLCDRTDFSKCS